MEVQAQSWWWEGGEGAWGAQGVVFSLLDGAVRVEAEAVSAPGVGWEVVEAQGVRVVLDAPRLCALKPGRFCEVIRGVGVLTWQRVGWDAEGTVEGSGFGVEIQGHRLFARSLLWERGAGLVTLEGVDVALCQCGPGSQAPEQPLDTAEGLAPTLHLARWQTALRAGDLSVVRTNGEGVRLGVLGIRWPLLFGEVHGEDGRASGLLWPRLGYSGSMGWYGALPLFLRLGPSADVTLEGGFAQHLGATLESRWRWALDPLSEGFWDLNTAWGADGPRLWTRGQGRFQLGDLGGVALEGDFVSDLALNRVLARDLSARAKRYGRSRVGVGVERAPFYLWAVGDVLQPLPAAGIGLEGSQAFEPFPARLATFHRLPWVAFGWWANVSEWLRWDLDADYVQALTFGETADQDPLLAGAPTTAHQALVQSALSAAWSVWGFGRALVAANLTQRLVIAERADAQTAFHRDSAFTLSAGLETSLLRRYPFAVHLVEPSVVWRWVPKHSTDDRLGTAHPWSRQQQMPPLTQTLEGGAASRWIGPDWRLTTQASVGLVWDEALAERAGCGSVCALLSTRLSLRFPSVGFSFDGATRYALYDLERLTGRASLTWRSPSGPLVGVGHASASDMALWFDASPVEVIPGSPWRRVEGEASTMMSTTRLGWRASRWGVEGAFAWAWDTDPDAEIGLGADFTAACGCWRVGVVGLRHMTAPRWDAWLSLGLSLDGAYESSVQPVLPNTWP